MPIFFFIFVLSFESLNCLQRHNPLLYICWQGKLSWTLLIYFKPMLLLVSIPGCRLWLFHWCLSYFHPNHVSWFTCDLPLLHSHPILSDWTYFSSDLLCICSHLKEPLLTFLRLVFILRITQKCRSEAFLWIWTSDKSVVI